MAFIYIICTDIVTRPSGDQFLLFFCYSSLLLFSTNRSIDRSTSRSDVVYYFTKQIGFDQGNMKNLSSMIMKIMSSTSSTVGIPHLSIKVLCNIISVESNCRVSTAILSVFAFLLLSYCEVFGETLITNLNCLSGVK